ncbi:MAG: type IV toxin-antitoxin system AbiEi family antitoxin domain-containing protein [Planctomycetota bacterium]|jgi:predicted transcriptional regulator of viral defense system|nr:type IV toxin-antitoxin system AbiEi family antitoxin domain-containing protein [Planctomycetota bacterium]
MTTAIQRAHAIIRNRGGTIRTSDALRAGIHRRTLYAMRDGGQLEQQARGVYRLMDIDPPADPDLALVTERIPHGVICLISALAIHELTTQIPHAVHLAIPRTARYPTLPEVSLEVYRFASASYETGIERLDHDGLTVQVYDPDKTIADCFKYRNKIGLDLVLEALKNRRRQSEWSPQRILDYARVNRVATQLTPYLEAIL